MGMDMGRKALGVDLDWVDSFMGLMGYDVAWFGTYIFGLIGVWVKFYHGMEYDGIAYEYMSEKRKSGLFYIHRTEQKQKTTLSILVQPYLLCVTMNNSIFVVFFFLIRNPPRVIHLAHIDELLAACAGNVFGVALAHEGFVGGFDGVHGVSRAIDARGEVVDTGGAAHFEDEVLAAEAEACIYISLTI